MAANDEFPRGYSSFLGNPGTITLPACPGIAHVIEEVKAQLIVNGTSGEFEIRVSSTSLGTVLLGQVTATSAGLIEDTLDATLTLMGGYGEAVSIIWNGTIVAGQAGYLSVKWHDV